MVEGNLPDAMHYTWWLGWTVHALGNLDTTSFEMLDRRRDLLVTYGPYGAPGLLAKVAGPRKLPPDACCRMATHVCSGRRRCLCSPSSPRMKA